jgi:hypothetical protein
MANLFSRIFNGAVTLFDNAAAEVEADYAKLIKVFPGIAPVAAAEVGALKQQLSNAFAFVDTELKPHYADATSMVESAADTLILGLTKGVAAPAIPAVNVAMTSGFALLHAVLDKAEVEAKAALQLPPPTAATPPTVASIGNAAASAAAGAASAVLQQATSQVQAAH